eukprot:FR735430.1.p2 GENE.FR735430.1~~FR735430.1.p2  ORF type:complete len:101 (+),score=9.91 FR735430.1:361-663(+)
MKSMLLQLVAFLTTVSADDGRADVVICARPELVFGQSFADPSTIWGWLQSFKGATRRHKSDSGIMLFEMEGTLDLYSCTRRWMESGAHRVTGKRGLENER